MHRLILLGVALFLANCKTIGKAQLSEVDLEQFPEIHQCKAEPDPGATFEPDAEFKQIVEALGAQTRATRIRAQSNLNDYLLTKNHQGRARFLIQEEMERSSDAEVRARLKDALTTCDLASLNQVPTCWQEASGEAISYDHPGSPSNEYDPSRPTPANRVYINFFIDPNKLGRDSLSKLDAKSGGSCREAAENTLAVYAELREHVREYFKGELGTFKLQFSPDPYDLVQPNHCCRAGGRVILLHPSSRATPQAYGVVPVHPAFQFASVRLIDSIENSTKGFEKLCQNRAGKILIADPSKREYLDYEFGTEYFTGYFNVASGSALGLRSVEEATPRPETTYTTQKNLGCFPANANVGVQVWPEGPDAPPSP